MLKRILLYSSIATIVLGAGLAAAQQTMAPYTAAQATQGRSEYMANCASCHQANLSGGGEAPSLAAGNFMKSWGGKSTRELFSYIRSAMPLGRGGSLPDTTYPTIAAFLLQPNGATRGGTQLTASPDVKIGLIANGVVPADIAAGTTRAAPPAPMRTGLTVAGSVTGYEPVSDAMLRDPPVGDWLMGRRNYQGWSYSPLGQITPANVKNLQLKWAGAMNEGGASEITPTVHDGVIFLSNTDNIVQPLDARTGKLIWENRLGPRSPH